MLCLNETKWKRSESTIIERNNEEIYRKRDEK